MLIVFILCYWACLFSKLVTYILCKSYFKRFVMKNVTKSGQRWDVALMFFYHMSHLGYMFMLSPKWRKLHFYLAHIYPPGFVCSLIPRVHDVLTSVTSVIGYIHPLVEATILTAVYDVHSTLCIFLCQISWKVNTRTSFIFSGSPYCTKFQLEGLY